VSIERCCCAWELSTLLRWGLRSRFLGPAVGAMETETQRVGGGATRYQVCRRRGTTRSAVRAAGTVVVVVCAGGREVVGVVVSMIAGRRQQQREAARLVRGGRASRGKAGLGESHGLVQQQRHSILAPCLLPVNRPRGCSPSCLTRPILAALTLYNCTTYTLPSLLHTCGIHLLSST
jgi:hypothetical protein